MSNYGIDGNERNGTGGFSSLPDLNNFNSLDQMKAGVHIGDNLATARAKMAQYQSASGFTPSFESSKDASNSGGNLKRILV